MRPVTGPTVRAYRFLPFREDASDAGSRVVFACLAPRFQPVARLSGFGGLLVPVIAGAVWVPCEYSTRRRARM